MTSGYDVFSPTTRPKHSFFLTYNNVSEYTVDITYIISDNAYIIQDITDILCTNNVDDQLDATVTHY